MVCLACNTGSSWQKKSGISVSNVPCNFTVGHKVIFMASMVKYCTHGVVGVVVDVSFSMF